MHLFTREKERSKMYWWVPLAATFQRLTVLHALRQDCQQAGVLGLWTVGSLAWGRCVCVTTQSDIDVYLVGSPQTLERCLTTSRLLASSATVLLPLLTVLRDKETQIDMISAKVHFTDIPPSTVTLLSETSFARLMNREIPSSWAGDFTLRLRNLRPAYQHQMKRAYAFDGSWIDLETPFEQSREHLPGPIRQDLIALSHQGSLRASLLVSHLLTHWLLWDRDGSIARGITRFISAIIRRYWTEYPDGNGEGLLNITGVKERMPWWLRWLWTQQFNMQLCRRTHL
jgi:hypothetical protein